MLRLNLLRNRKIIRFMKNKLAVFGIIFLFILIIIVIFAPLIAPYGINEINLETRYNPPSKLHILGTDSLGRDMFSRIIYGARVSILVGLSGTIISSIIGIILGGVSGYFGKILDRILLHLSEIIVTFPSIILVLILVTILGQSIVNLILVFGFTMWTSIYRLVRAQLYSLKEKEFVDALRAFGINNYSIIFRHILPNTLGPIFVWFTLNLAVIILAEAGLSFLGLGVPITSASLGGLLNNAQDINVLRNYQWLWIPPGIAITLIVLSVNFIGDGLRDAIDPRQFD